MTTEKDMSSIVYIEESSNYIIVIGNWEDQITEDENLDPFWTYEAADEYRRRNL